MPEGTRGNRGLNTAGFPCCGPGEKGRAAVPGTFLSAAGGAEGPGKGRDPPRWGSGGSGTRPGCPALPLVLMPAWVERQVLAPEF